MESAAGSSPLTRGAPRQGWLDARNAGLIPAYAGSTSQGEIGQLVNEAHPRLRGEHYQYCARPMKTEGSSPLTRGAR